MIKHRSNNQSIRGITMIEVLVTMIILSIGLLGLAGLQLTGMRSVNSASLRTQATVLINDITERMRANPVAINNNQFMNIDSTAIDCNATPAPYCAEYNDSTSGAVVNAAQCTSTQLAIFDVSNWYCGTLTATNGGLTGGVQTVLPQATATIVCNDTEADPLSPDGDPCTDTSTHTITLTWSELNSNRSGNSSPISQTLQVTMQP